VVLDDDGRDGAVNLPTQRSWPLDVVKLLQTLPSASVVPEALLRRFLPEICGSHTQSI
jgi:hypothetical protein